MREMTVDDEMDAYWEANYIANVAARRESERVHRCPADMPPCPDCQAVQEREDELEFGL